MTYGDMLCNIISDVRGEKSSNNLSLKTVVKELELDCSTEVKEAIESSMKDFKATLFIEKLTIYEHGDCQYQIHKIELDTEEK